MVRRARKITVYPKKSQAAAHGYKGRSSFVTAHGYRGKGAGQVGYVAINKKGIAK